MTYPQTPGVAEALGQVQKSLTATNERLTNITGEMGRLRRSRNRLAVVMAVLVVAGAAVLFSYHHTTTTLKREANQNRADLVASCDSGNGVRDAIRNVVTHLVALGPPSALSGQIVAYVDSQVSDRACPPGPK